MGNLMKELVPPTVYWVGNGALMKYTNGVEFEQDSVHVKIPGKVSRHHQ